tara:strand:- start:202 stop:651 length:450 start_codon:yes stop_codon:yes gene_type:complete
MKKKNITLISLIFFLTSCGFSPLYLTNNDVNFSIESVVYTGDRDLNDFLKPKLKQYKNENIDNKISIETESTFRKIVLSKDGTGEVTNYQLEAEVIFLISPLDKRIKINEKKTMDSMNDKFEEARYIRSIKQNFASSIANKLSSELIIN